MLWVMRARVVVVCGARGGVGATTAAAVGAIVAARTEEKVLLCDFDSLGPGIDVALGVEAQQGFRWSDFARLTAPPEVELIKDRLPSVSALDVLACSHENLDEVWPIAALVLPVLVDRYSLLVVDAPRGCLPRIAELLSEGASRIDASSVTWALVCTNDVYSVRAARKVKSLIPGRLQLIVREEVDSSGGLKSAQVADALECATYSRFPFDRRLRRAIVQGEFSQYCAATLKGSSTNDWFTDR